MSPAAMVLVCALDVLGRSAERLPRIELLDVRPPDVTATAEAFVLRDAAVIYLIATSPAFRAASLGHPDSCAFRDRTALKKIASIIVHEEWHLKNGEDEKGAYEAQLTELARLGSGAGTAVYAQVSQSMRAVLKARAIPERTAMLAAR